MKRYRIGKIELTARELRNGIVGGVALFIALAAAVVSSFTARAGNLPLTMVLTSLSLILAGILAFTAVPALFRRVRLEWLPLPFRITREGWAYLLVLFIVGLAAFNTNNNLLFIVFSATLATLLVSGVLSRANLRGVKVEVESPDSVEACRAFPALVRWQQPKSFWPAFSISLETRWPALGGAVLGTSAAASLDAYTYLPYLPPKGKREAWITMEFPRRGLYVLGELKMSSAFPFGFVRRTTALNLRREVIALPELAPPNEFFETLPMVTGSAESRWRGDGSDLYSIRDYSCGDNARFLDWKASAKTGQLKVREFTREDERRCCFVFDNYFPDFREARHRSSFERGVKLCANLLRHFHEMASETRLRTPQSATVFSSSSDGLLENLKILALLEPGREGLHFFSELAEESAFKIIFTSRPRGVIPTPVWNSSHVVFLREI